MTDEGQAAPIEGQAAPASDAQAAIWTDGFSDDLSGYVETKGFKDAGSLAESYRNLEKLRGVPAEQLLQIPADQSDREAMLPVYAKMGMPDEAGGYTNVLGEDFNDDAFKGIAARAHELGLGDGQFQGLQQIVAEQVASQQEAMDTASADSFDAWKSGNADGFNNAARLMADVNMTEDKLETLLSGDKTGMYDFLATIAQKVGDAQVIQGEPSQGDGGFTMSPSAAKTKVASLMADSDFMKQYTSENKNVRQPAIDRMMKLQEAAARA